MSKKSVAVLDVRSAEISLIVGEKGVNGTFIFKAENSASYDGYADGKFFREEKLKDIVFNLISDSERTCGERIKKLFVGVPGAFLKIIPKQQTISFPKRRKITGKEIDLLYESGKEKVQDFRYIRAASMIYITADNRRVVDPAGLASSKLSGLLSYFYASEYFISVVENCVKDMGIQLAYLPTEYAMANYLIPSETRDEYALFLDTGFLSATAYVLLGNGVLAQKSFWTGRGHIIVRLMQKFSMSYGAAELLLKRTNLYSKKNAGSFELEYQDETYNIDSDTLIDTVEEGLDELCEAITQFFETSAGQELDYKPLYVSGEGITEIRGALEHVGKRLNRVVEPLAPSLPYYNKPSVSSRIALIDLASGDQKRNSFLYRLFGGNGG